jgi:hypothetical protein
MRRPDPTEYAASYETYVRLVPEADVLAAMDAQLHDFLAFMAGVPESEGGVRHPPYTWSVKQVVGHLTDCERVFSHRAFRFSRNDPTPLPTFDENEYVAAAGFDWFPLADLVSEFETARRSSLWLFRHLPAGAWDRVGVASDNPVTVRALAYCLVGHVRHHGAILRKRLAAAGR